MFSLWVHLFVPNGSNLAKFPLFLLKSLWKKKIVATSHVKIATFCHNSSLWNWDFCKREHCSCKFMTLNVLNLFFFKFCVENFCKKTWQKSKKQKKNKKVFWHQIKVWCHKITNFSFWKKLSKYENCNFCRFADIVLLLNCNTNHNF